MRALAVVLRMQHELLLRMLLLQEALSWHARYETTEDMRPR